MVQVLLVAHFLTCPFHVLVSADVHKHNDTDSESTDTSDYQVAASSPEHEDNSSAKDMSEAESEEQTQHIPPKREVGIDDKLGSRLLLPHPNRLLVKL